MELKDFSQRRLRVEDFTMNLPKPPVNISSTSRAQIAAGEQMFTETPSIEGYEASKTSLSTKEGRDNYRNQIELRRQAMLEEYAEPLSEVLISEVSPEIRNQYIEGVREAPLTQRPNSIDFIAEESLVADSRPDETPQEEQARMSIMGVIKEVNNEKSRISHIINGIAARRDPSTVDSLVDIAETIVPFTEWIAINDLYSEVTGEDGFVKEEMLLGEQKAALYTAMESMTDVQRIDFIEKVVDYVDNNDSLIVGSSNDLFVIDTLENMLLDNTYTDTWRFIDNATSVLDVLGVGTALRAAVKPVKGASRLKATTALSETATVPDELDIAAQGTTLIPGGPNSEAVSVLVLRPEDMVRARTHNVQTTVNPTSPMEVVKDTNPEKTRTMAQVINEDPTDEAAEALAGTNKTDATARFTLPEPNLGSADQTVVVNKVRMEGPQFPEPEEIQRLRTSDGRIYLNDVEDANLKQKIISKFEDVVGMTPVKEQTAIRMDRADNLSLNMVFRPTDAGFTSYNAAISNAEFAFRNQGLTADNFNILVREGDKWVEKSKEVVEGRMLLKQQMLDEGMVEEAAKMDSEFAIGINFNYRLDVNDLENLDKMTVGRALGIPLNLTDYLPPGMAAMDQGSLASHLFPPNALLHQQMVGAASVAVDRKITLEKAYQKLFEDFSKTYSNLKPERRDKMSEYIREANFEGLRFDRGDLLARGFNKDEIKALETWRRANDAMFYATNDDMVVNLRNRGYKFYVHKDSDTKLVVRPVSRNQVNANVAYYDPTTGGINRAVSKQELDEFYEKGGSYAKLDEPIRHEGEWIEYVRDTGRAEGGYTRAMNQGDQVLHYRDGYYPLINEGNYFITKSFKTGDGREFTKVIASAENRDDAQKLIDMQQAAEPDAKLDFRLDKKLDPSSRVDENGWNLVVSSGLSSQRIRGERLLDASADLHKADKASTVDPLRAVERSIMTLSRRVSTRNYLDAAKKRWIDNYGDKLDIPEGLEGVQAFPSSVKSIKPKGSMTKAELAEARTNFNYIYHLENGYANVFDWTAKAMFNHLSIVLADNGVIGSKFLRSWGERGITSDAKAAVFKMYLAANPARQLLIQGHQSVQLNAINPLYVSTGNLGLDMVRIGRAARGYKGDKEATELWNRFLESGQFDAVDANNLVRSDMMDMTALSFGHKTAKALNKPLEVAQRIGFDAGEQVVLLTSWLTHYDMAKKAKKSGRLTGRDFEKIAADARAFTYGMNQAGDMPYNQNSLNVMAQFLQVPHKAMLQPFLDRNLTKRQRGQLLAWNTVMYGIPTAAVGTVLYPLMEPSTERDVLEKGLEHVLLNEAFSQLTGEEQQIDWGDFAPTDLVGTSEFMVSLLQLDVGKLVTESPAHSLLFGQNPRLQNFFKTTARWVVPFNDYEDPALDTTYMDVALAAGNLFSGFSNYAKAKYAWETQKKMSSLGNINDDDVTKFEALMQAFGFRTETETGTQRVRELIYGNSEYTPDQFTADVEVWYTELKRQLARRGTTVRDDEMAQRIISEGIRVFEDQPDFFSEELIRLVNRDVARGENSVVELILRKAGVMTKPQLLEAIDAMPQNENMTMLRRQVEALGE